MTIKIRSAMFCLRCDLEIDISGDDQVHKCPHCGYYSHWSVGFMHEVKIPTCLHTHKEGELLNTDLGESEGEKHGSTHT